MWDICGWWWIGGVCGDVGGFRIDCGGIKGINSGCWFIGGINSGCWYIGGIIRGCWFIFYNKKYIWNRFLFRMNCILFNFYFLFIIIVNLYIKVNCWYVFIR